MELTSDQAAAVEALRGYHVARLTGLAGTGKTWLSLRLPRLLGWRGPTLYAAPTHRAGSVLASNAARDGLRIDVTTTWAATKGAPERVRHCRSCPGEADCHADTIPGGCPVCGALDPDSARSRDISASYQNVIVDEASMLTQRDYDDLMKQAEGLSHVLLVGDPGQLPPVARTGEEEWSSLESVDLPTAHLSDIQRQAEDSPIIQAAHRVRGLPGQGHALFAGAPWTPGSVEFQADDALTLPRLEGGLPVLCDSVSLVHNNRTRVVLNARLRAALFGADAPAVVVGDVVRSRYSERSLSRARVTKDQLGQVVVVRSSGKQSSLVDLRMETGRLVDQVEMIHEELASVSASGVRWLYGHAMTVHAAQGSEFRQVAYYVQPRDDHRMAYTAITRARDRVVVYPCRAR